MRVLVLGGTLFLGRHVVEAAVQRGDDVTIFSRGETNPGVHPSVRAIRGDRTGDLSELGGETWDVVIDTWAKVPSLVRASAAALAGRTGRYLFVSSISVFGPGTAAGFDESTPTLAPAAPDEEWDPERYGELKVACEREAESAMRGRTLIVRPGLIVGPYDPSDRFTYWPARLARGGEVLAPGRPARTIQIIHAADLAGWMLSMLERGETGVWHATGPPTSFGDMIDACAAASGADARVVWAGEDWLLAQGVEPWSEMPVWLPESSEHAHLMAADIGKASGAGLRSRPVEVTARETLAWDRSRGDGPRAAGLDPGREAELLARLLSE